MVSVEDQACEPQPEPQPEHGLPAPQRSEHHLIDTIHDPDSLSESSPAQCSSHNNFPILDNADLSVLGANAPDLLGANTHPANEDPNSGNMLLDSFMFDSLSWPWHHEISYLLGPEPLSFVDQTSTRLQQDDSDEPQNMQPIADVNDTVQMSSAAQTSGNHEHTSSANHSMSNSETGIEQTRVLEDIIAFALSVKSDASTSLDYSPSWYTFSLKVARVFNIEQSGESEGMPLLGHFVHLFFRHFEPLWPMFSLQNLSINRLHPLLYLVLTSIGAMYGDNQSSYFGTKMHARVQACLVEPLELRDPEYDAPWLAQTRCHSRVAALYFGQSRAISHAHHLGTLLAAQVRRMELFSAAYSLASMERFRNLDGSLTDQERLAIWLRLESRRRLAFGIYRSEAYTSLLLQSKPLFYLGEIDLAFPSCDAVWNGHKMDASVCIQLIENDQTPGRDLDASEIYYIALDRGEDLPPMDPLGYELLALGLLWPTWEYSRNPTLLSRLCGEELSVPDELGDIAVTESSTTHSASPRSSHSGAARPPFEIRDYDHLDRTSRKMLDLHSGYKRLLLALRKWEQSLPLVKSFVRSQRDRTLLMSGLVVHHLVYLRLSAPAAHLHELQYGMRDGRLPDASSMASIVRWLQSPRSRFAAERAVSIWSLIAGECTKAAQERARFNLVAFAGLHDAAVLLWAYASTIPSNEPSGLGGSVLALRSRDSQTDCTVNRENTTEILRLFGSLLDIISPVQSSSFAQATKSLMGIPFPYGGGLIAQ